MIVLASLGFSGCGECEHQDGDLHTFANPPHYVLADVFGEGIEHWSMLTDGLDLDWNERTEALFGRAELDGLAAAALRERLLADGYESIGTEGSPVFTMNGSYVEEGRYIQWWWVDHLLDQSALHKRTSLGHVVLVWILPREDLSAIVNVQVKPRVFTK